MRATLALNGLIQRTGIFLELPITLTGVYMFPNGDIYGMYRHLL